MGCAGSKADTKEASPSDTTSAPPAEAPPTTQEDTKEDVQAESGLPASKVPPTLDEANSDERYSQVRAERLSVRYQAKEIASGRASSRKTSSARNASSRRRSSAPFDNARIGTHTRHGIMPGPRGFSAAKINQDRGVVCWPFNGSYNQALLCIFDGHGSKGEKVSEFCMKTVPELLEADPDELRADPVGCLTKNVIKCDELLLGGELGAMAMNCGTTSTVVYMKGAEVLVACSGDSRAVMGTNQGGKVIASDLSRDHKPDHPQEMARIVAAGGTVSMPGPNNRPARVWANGRVGLAMSRSLGDGLCKRCGVIPDPEVMRKTLSLPSSLPGTKPIGEHDSFDSFIIVASDGVWEFISSQAACELVAKYESATDACTALVQEAEASWKRFEGSYRDDITAIVVYLPFLEDEGEDEGECKDTANLAQTTKECAAPAEDDSHTYVNNGAVGLSRLDHIELSPPLKEGTNGEKAAAEDEPGADNGNDFVQRRLSVHDVFDDEWNKEGDVDGWGAEEAPDPKS